ncbi:MAG TPA: response regulator transcription factor [Acidimicrobiales bacterium]|nr:response regulator transcription factor [Acidimicrobiales bacterium]
MTAPAARTRVLVCDDQVLVRTGYATIFAAHPDLEVVGDAADGQQAVELARRLHPDVAVMDVRMPVMDGIEATRLLAGPDVPNPVKVLVITTFNLDEYVFEALRAGASGFLLKDAPPDELVAGVRTVAAGDALLSPAVTRRLIGGFASRLRPEGPDAKAEHLLADLSNRELEVLKQVAAGMSNAEIATAMFVSGETVKTYVSRLFQKLGLHDRVHAVIFAYGVGIVT